MNDPSTLTPASQIQHLCLCLANWEDCESIQQPKKIDDQQAKELANILRSQSEALDSIISALQLMPLADSGRFFDFISGASLQIGYGAARGVVLGILWAEVYVRAGNATRQRLLKGLLTDRNFFTPLYCLPSFVERVSIPTDQIAEWLMQIRDRLDNDGASGGFWGAIFALAVNHPQQSLELLARWTADRPDERVTEMAAKLLGRLRSTAPELTESIDTLLQNHLDEARRVVFHQSWAHFDQFRPIEPAEYEALVYRMTRGTPAELEEAIDLVCSSLPAGHRLDSSFAFGCHWLHAQIHAAHGIKRAYAIIQLAIHCDKRTADLGLPPFRDLVPSFCPIPKERQEIWYSVQQLLIGLLGSDYRVFEQLLFSLAHADCRGLLERFSSRGNFGELANLLSHGLAEDLTANALSSLDERLRLLGIVLFRCLRLESLSETTTAQWSDEWVAVLIYQLQMGLAFEIDDTRFLCALLPRIRHGGDELREFFLGELVWQMKNLPGGALSAVKALAERSNDDLLSKAVEMAEAYLINLDRCSQSAINSMHVGGYRLAKRLKDRRWSKQMSEAENRSPLLSLITKSYNLYGGEQWQCYFGEGCLQPVQSMSGFSHSAELPRFPAIDPDGYAQRRRRARRHMRELVEEETQRRGGMV